MLNGKQLLNNTDIQNFPQKCLFILRMIGVFINVYKRIWWYFYQNFHDHDTRLVWIEKQLIPPGYSILNSETDFAYILPQGHWLMAVWTWAAETRAFWWCQIFRKIIICIKNFFISKRQLFFLWVLEFPNLLLMTLGKLSVLCPESGLWTGILLIQNVTP